MLEKREEESIKDLKEATGLNNKSTTNWYDKNKFNKILTAIDSSNFNHKNKIGKFRFNDINNLINNMKTKIKMKMRVKLKVNMRVKMKMKMRKMINTTMK